MKTVTILCYTILILTILLFIGRVKYVNACDACAKCEGSDQAIENTLYQYGFNIGWNDTPTITDYIVSNFK